jgi:anti-sigma B factor antagonist
MTIEIERCSASEVTVRCHGRLVAGATDVLTSGVRPLIASGRRIVLDLSDLKHTDSMGLGALVRLYVAAKSAGCSLELMHLSKQIRHLLGITHMLDIFTVVGETGVKFM